MAQFLVPGQGGSSPAASAAQQTGNPLSFKEWLSTPDGAPYVYSTGGATQAYQSYVKGFSSDAAQSIYDGFDVTGYSQSGWDLEKTRELLEEQREYNSAEAEKNRQWQERMSNTAYQRATEDLEAAGLNKWLAVTGGNGASASTPSGSTATSSAGNASTPNPSIYIALIKAMSSVFSSAMKLL